VIPVVLGVGVALDGLTWHYAVAVVTASGDFLRGGFLISRRRTFDGHALTTISGAALTGRVPH
jgi:hypothetical protein